MPFKIPKQYQLLYSADEIRDAVSRLGAEVSKWVEAVEADSGEQVLAVGILRGGVIFYTDLVRALSTSVEFAFCNASSYSSSANKSMQRGVDVSLENVKAKGRSVLLIDDLCDSGVTLSAVHQEIQSMGAREIKSAVFIYKLIENPPYQPDWSAFRYKGDEWLVGYGMEDKNHNCNLPGAYIIKS